MPKKTSSRRFEAYIPEETGQSYSYPSGAGSNAPEWGGRSDDRYMPDEDSEGNRSRSYSYPSGAGRNAPRPRGRDVGYLPDEDSKGPNYNYDRFRGQSGYPQKEAGYLPWNPPKEGPSQSIRTGEPPPQDSVSGPTVMGVPRFQEYGRQEIPESDSIEYGMNSGMPHDADGYLDPNTGRPRYQEQGYAAQSMMQRKPKGVSVAMVLPWGVPGKVVPRNPLSRIDEGPLMDWGSERISEMVLQRLGLPIPGQNMQAPQEDPKAALLRALTNLGVTRR